LNLGIEALAGETDMVTVFDDFNQYIDVRDLATATTGGLEDNGWTITQVGGAAAGSGVGINDDASVLWDSCLRVNCGTADDQGGNLQLIPGAGETHFPHIWIADSGTATALDSTTFVFACRVGLVPEGTTWAAKAFIGWAQAGDTSIMTAATGVITIASTGALVGFHIPEDGSIDGISHRTAATAMAEGTNFTDLTGTGWNTGLTAGAPVWFDLALRMDITDMSDDNANGATRFYWRGPLNSVTGGAGSVEFNAPGEGYPPWREHGTVLTNQTPNDGTILVPTIEAINGAAGNEGDVLVDWWAMGVSRFSR
jgi:hypothetical protein